MLKRLIRITNDLKLKHKLLISYVLVVMIPVLIIGLAVTSYFRQQALDNAIGQTIINVDKIKSQTATMLRVPTDISNMLMFNTDLKEIVNRRYKSVVELTSAYLAYKDFQEYRRLYREVAGIRFYSTNPTLINNLEFIPVNERTKESYWYKEALKTTSIGWFYIPGNEDNPVHRLSLVRKVPFAEYKTEGVLMIVINQEELNGLLRQEQFETLITDEQGYVVAAKNTELVGKTLDELDFGVDLQSQPKGTIEADFQGEPSNIVIDELGPGSSFNKLKVISVFATKNIVKDANQISQIGMIFITLVLVIALLLVYIISFLTSNRLLRLSKHLNKLALGDLNVTSRIDGNDEIGQLSRQFNYMVKSINELMTQVVETTEQNNRLEIAQKEIKLKMMASQINPHFLFNALESIRMKAHIKGEAEIANIVRLLGKLMRKSLEIGSGKTTFRAELEMVRSYLEIQKFRYGDRLAFEIHLDPVVEKMYIPPLIIQPIVENAIVHGLENKEGQVQVHIHICMKDGMVRVKVKDDGAGITPERLAEVMQFVSGPEEEERSRIGMRNVHQRLTLTYGENSGLQINSMYGEGTEVSFTLPAGGTSMYKVLLVDDEPSIREGLTTIIDWEKYSFQVMATAGSGREAIACFNEMLPDLTIIDIRMPGMTGLEVIEELRVQHPDAHFLILSGYADFDYAKKAISFGVDGYLLKPVDEDEIIAELERIAVQLNQERETLARYAGEDTVYREHQIEALLYDSLQGEGSVETDSLGLHWPQYQVILLEIHAGSDLQRSNEMKRKLVEAFDQKQRGIVFSFHSGLGLLTQEVVNQNSTSQSLYDELQTLLAEWDVKMYAAAGEPVQSTAEIARSYTQASSLLAERFLFTEQRIKRWEEGRISPRDEQEDHSAAGADGLQEPDEVELADKLYYALDIRSSESVMRVLGEMEDRLVTYYWTEQAVKTAFSQVFSLAFNKLAAANEQMQSIMQEHSVLINEVYHQLTIADLIAMSAEHLNRLIQRMGGGSKDTVMKQMIEFIQRNPGENLKLEVLAEVFNYNSSYLGKLFKNHTGEYFNAFLDKVRIEKAKTLLDEGLKVHQVAARVGYANVDYFHSKFKKYVGESPSAYKQSRSQS